jgi:hypothetical protein
LFPNIRIIIADGGHQSRRLTRELLKQAGWTLQIVKRRQRKFKIKGLTWIVERSFAWLGRNRRLSKDYEYRVKSSETSAQIRSRNTFPLLRHCFHQLRTLRPYQCNRYRHVIPVRAVGFRCDLLNPGDVHAFPGSDANFQRSAAQRSGASRPVMGEFSKGFHNPFFPN